MKKIILSLSVLLIVACSSAFAYPPDDPDPEVEAAFKKEFPGAQAVTWTVQDGFHKATFILAGHRTIAFFDSTEELVGCVRDIFYDQLPITVMKAIEKKFEQADYSEVREVSNADGTSYLLTIDKDTKKYKVKISSDGFFTNIEKKKK